MGLSLPSSAIYLSGGFGVLSHGRSGQSSSLPQVFPIFSWCCSFFRFRFVFIILSKRKFRNSFWKFCLGKAAQVLTHVLLSRQGRNSIKRKPSPSARLGVHCCHSCPADLISCRLFAMEELRMPIDNAPAGRKSHLLLRISPEIKFFQINPRFPSPRRHGIFSKIPFYLSRLAPQFFCFSHIPLPSGFLYKVSSCFHPEVLAHPSTWNPFLLFGQFFFLDDLNREPLDGPLPFLRLPTDTTIFLRFLPPSRRSHSWFIISWRFFQSRIPYSEEKSCSFCCCLLGISRCSFFLTTLSVLALSWVIQSHFGFSSKAGSSTALFPPPATRSLLQGENKACHCRFSQQSRAQTWGDSRFVVTVTQ